MSSGWPGLVSADTSVVDWNFARLNISMRKRETYFNYYCFIFLLFSFDFFFFWSKIHKSFEQSFLITQKVAAIFIILDKNRIKSDQNFDGYQLTERHNIKKKLKLTLLELWKLKLLRIKLSSCCGSDESASANQIQLWESDFYINSSFLGFAGYFPTDIQHPSNSHGGDFQR